MAPCWKCSCARRTNIYRELQVHVPVPVNSETVMEAVLHSLFERTTRYDGQMSLFDQEDDAGRLVRRVHDDWNIAAHDRGREPYAFRRSVRSSPKTSSARWVRPMPCSAARLTCSVFWCRPANACRLAW